MNRIVAVREVEPQGMQTPCGFIPKGSDEMGYGKKIHTRYEVMYSDSKKWYKVYCACFSNVGSLYTSRGYDGVELALSKR